jgi:broad specificity phosphatase PhoE
VSTENPTPSRLLLVRHGQDRDNSRSLINGRRDTPLTELGQSQARAVADGLRSESISCIYASPLRRARETASIVAAELSVPALHVEPDLIERDYGVLTGKPVSDIPRHAGKTVMSNGFRYVIDSPGVEDYPRLWTRARDALGRIRRRHADQTVLIVAHNEVIKMMRSSFHGRSWKDELRRGPIGHCEIIALV